MCTYLAANIPHGHRVVVGGVSSGASWVDPAEFVHVVMHEGGSYGNNNIMMFQHILVFCS